MPDGWKYASSEEKVDLIANTDAALKQVEIVRELRNIADGVVDPIKANAGGFLGDLENAAYGASRSLPYTLTAALPGGLVMTGVAVAGGEYDRMRSEYRDMDPDVVGVLAVASAALQAPIEVLQARAIFGRMPATAALLQKMGDVRLPLPARIGAAFVGNFTEQNAQEFLQDGISLTIDAVSAAVRQDMPEFEAENAFRGFLDSRFDTALMLLPLALVGGGAMSLREMKRGELYVADKRTLRMGGFSEKVASEIAAEPDLEAKSALIRSEWDKRTPEDIKAGQQMAAEAADQAKADQEDPAKPTLEVKPQAGGGHQWIVRDSQGDVQLATRDLAAATQAYTEIAKSDRSGQKSDENQRDAAENNLLGNDLNAVNLFSYSELELDPATADRLRAIEEGLRKDARAAGAPAGSEKVVRRGASARDNETAQLGRSALEFIAGFEHLTGKKVEFVDTPRNPDVPFAALVNKAKPNTIYLHTRGDRNVIALIGHEWGHTLQQQDPKLYRELQIKLLPLVDSWRRRTKELATDYRRKVRSEELTNNIIGDAFAHPDFWQFLSEQNKPLFSKVRQSIKQWFEAMFFKARGSSWGTESFISDLEAVHNAVMQTLETAAKRGPYSELPAVDDTELSTQKPRKDGSPETSQVRFSKSTVTPSDIGAAFLSLSENPETARLGPTPSQKDLPSILRTLSPKNSAQISIQPDAGIFGEGFTFHSPGGSIYLVKDDNTTYHVNSAGAGKFGTDIYQAIYAWAHNNGKVVREDDVMLDDGIFRRTSQMLSSAIRFQTTRHMTVGGWSGIKGWRKGDSPEAITHNVGLLAMRERDIVRERLPILDEIRYDLETNAFYDEGHRIPDEEIETYLGERIDRVGSEVPDRVGPSTLRRALVVNELERSGTGSQRGMLGGLSRENKSLAEIRYAKDTGRGQELEENAFGKGARRETPEPKSLDASFTIQNRDSTGEPASVSGRVGPERSRQTLVSNHPTVSRVEQILDGIQSRWGSRLKTKVHASVREISDAQLRADALETGNVEAFFNPNDGTIHVIADRVTSVADAERLLRHEGIHWALTGPLKKQYAAIREQAGRRIPWDEMQKLIAKYPEGNVDLWIEEYLAYQGQTNPQSTVWRQFVLEVKTLLKNLGINVEFTDADILAFLQKANRRMERAGEADQRFFDASNREALYAKSKPKGPQRSSWDEVRKGDRWNSVKKLLPKENIQPPVFPTHGTKDDIVRRAAQFLKSHSVVTDWTGRTIYLPNGETDGGYSDPILNRAEHITANEKIKGSHQRTVSIEKAEMVATIPLTITQGKVRVRQGNEILYFRSYSGRVHMVVTTNTGVVVNQQILGSGLVTQYPVDIKRPVDGAVVDSVNR